MTVIYIHKCFLGKNVHKSEAAMRKATSDEALDAFLQALFEYVHDFTRNVLINWQFS